MPTCLSFVTGYLIIKTTHDDLKLCTKIVIKSICIKKWLTDTHSQSF